MKNIIGGISIAVGLLFAGLSGLCSLMMLSETRGSEASDMLPAIAIFGGIPFAIGIGMIWLGYYLIKKWKPD